MGHRRVFSSGLFSLRKEETQDDSTLCVGDDLEPVTFDLSVSSVPLG